MTSPTLILRDVAVQAGRGAIVHKLDMSLERGKTTAIVGESGSGKSILAKTISGLLPNGVTATGQMEIDGHTIDFPGTPEQWQHMRGSVVSLLMQDPFTSLSPVHRCGKQLVDTIRAHRKGPISQSEMRTAVREALAAVNLPEHVAQSYPSELSGGMRQRVSIAAAIIPKPVLLIADEPTTALDASNQGEILDLLASIQSETGMSMLLISHDLSLVRGRADNVAVMYAGRILEQGPVETVIDTPSHPYAAGLGASILPLVERLERLPAIPGSVPKPGEHPRGCAFAERCFMAEEACFVDVPTIHRLDNGAEVACFVSTGPIKIATPKTVADPAPLTGAPLLETHNLSKKFGHRTVLSEASIALFPTESVGIVGESGSGKTTLARCIAGLETADAGEMMFDGSVLNKSNRRVNDMQIVYQDPYSSLNPKIRVRDMLKEALDCALPEDRRSVEELLDMVQLPHSFASKYPRDLSGGERQRISIARAVAPAPRVLICDESVSALDVSVQAQILSLLANLRLEFGLSILFISHDLSVVRQTCERVYVMHKGRIIEEGSTKQVLLEPREDYTRQLVMSAQP
jgi:peptide/nickel transport system ATP-binding protein